MSTTFYFLALNGELADICDKKLPVASQAYLFIVANIGMGIGVTKGLIGKAPTS